MQVLWGRKHAASVFLGMKINGMFNVTFACASCELSKQVCFLPTLLQNRKSLIH